MRIEYLYEFMVVAHYNNFTAAAHNLHTSQPTLSKHISEVEKELGFKLFERGKHLKLTTAGVSFLSDTIQIHHLYKNALIKAREAAAQNTGELVIQQPYVMDATGEIIIKSVAAFRAKNPAIKVRYYTNARKKSLELLQSGDIDIALTVDCKSNEVMEQIGEKKGLLFYPLIKEPLIVRLPQNHPLVSKDRISLDDLLNIPIKMTSIRCFDPIRFAILDLFRNSLHATPNLHAYPVENMEEFFISSHSEGEAYLVTPVIAASQLMEMQIDMVSRLINDERAQITSYLVFRSDYQGHEIDTFLDTLEHVVHHDINVNEHAFYLDDAR